MDAIRNVPGDGSGGRQAAGPACRGAIHSRLYLLLAVLSAVLHPGASQAVYYAGIAGPDDISALRTPWYYIQGYPTGQSCSVSEQEAMAPVLAWAATLGGTCSVSYTGIDPWPSDHAVYASTSVSYCADTASQDFGPLPDISDQNAKPLYHQGSTFYWDRIATSTVCPDDLYTSHESYTIDRYAYEYCPAGYRFFYSSLPGTGNFCRRDAVPERDQGELCGTGDVLAAGNPIYLGTGKKYQRETDYVDARDERFVLERHYDSMGNGGMFGANWTSTYERSIGNTTTPAPQSVVVSRANGQRYYFNHIDGVWVSNSAVREILLQTQSGWSYITAGDVREHYDASGRLLSVVFPDGVMQHLFYDAAGRLSRVQTTTGESLTFGYRADHAPGLVESVTDHAGRVWHYRYNDQYSTLEYVLYPDGTPAALSDNPVRQYHYEDLNFPEALTGITDERGIRFSTYVYDGEGRAVISYLGSGIGRVDVDYNGADDYTDGTAARTVINSQGVASHYTTRLQNGVALLQSQSGPGCATCSASDTAYRYDPDTNVLLGTTVHGVSTAFGNHTANGNPGFVIEAVGSADERRTDLSYDPRYFSRVATRTEPSVYAGARKVTTYGYDDFGNRVLVKIEGYTPDGTPVSRTTRYQYEGPLHQLTRIDGPRTDVSDITTLRYYPDDPVEGANRARLKEFEDATGTLLRSNIHYSSTGKVLFEDRPNGVSLSYRYYPGSNRLESLEESAASGSRVTRWTYLATGETESVTVAAGTPDATTLMFGYDAARRLTRVTDGLGNYIEYSLDDEGNRIAETVYDSSGLLRKSLTSSFDLYSRLDMTSRANETVDYDYAPDGMLVRRSGGAGDVTDFSYDALKRLLGSTADPGGLNAGTRFGYDVADNLISVTDPLNGNTTFVYDDLGNLLKVDSPDSGTTIYTHDAAGNVKTRLDAKNQSFIYHYDALDRLVSVDAPGTADDIRYTYDTCVNGSGSLCSVVSAGGIVTYAYDAFGNVTAHQQITYGYDAADRITSVTYPSGSLVRYRYDAAGQVKQVDLNDGASVTTLASGISHAPFGPLESMTYGNGKTLAQGLDTAYRLMYQDIPGVLDAGYPDYDGNGNMVVRTDAYSADSHFSYDVLNRLETGTGAFGSRAYGYDLNGNRTRLSADTTATVYTYQPDSNRLLSASDLIYSLDTNGNTTGRLEAGGSGEGILFGYTSHNRLASVNERLLVTVGKGRKKAVSLVDQAVASYDYNGLGQRSRKSITAGSVAGYLYSPDGLLMAELDGTDAVQREYVYLGDQLLAVLDPVAAEDNPGVGIVVDNGAPPAGWVGKTSREDYGADYLYSAGDSGNTYSWTPQLTAGSYDVYIWYVDNRKNSKQVPFTIIHNGQLDTLLVDQTLNGGRWKLIAQNITFDGAGGEYIEVSDVNGRTTADAVRFVNVTGGPEATTTTVSYVHNDHLGTPQVMTDDAGKVVWRTLYDPFGKALVDTASVQTLNVRFPGQYYDEETGLHYNYYRYYDPDVGRYLTADPRGQVIDFSDPVRQVSATTGIEIPRRNNFGYLNHSYVYVNNNPVNRADPTGEIDPVTAGLIIWGFLYINNAGDAISDPNGNLFSYTTPQDEACTLGPIGPVADSCPNILKRCLRHDDCYALNECNATSWVPTLLGGSKLCNQCNTGFFSSLKTNYNVY